MLFIWVSPIILFLVLSATRLVSALAAALLALTLAAVVVIWVGPVFVTPVAFAAMFIAGAWIALPAVLVILAGLYFTEVIAPAKTPMTSQPLQLPSQQETSVQPACS